jgi:hypothetical protein
MFNVCPARGIGSAADIDFIIGWAEGALGNMAQINYPYQVGNLVAWPVNASCDAAIAVNPKTGDSASYL